MSTSQTHTSTKQFEQFDPQLIAFYTDLSDTKGLSREAIEKKRLGCLSSACNHKGKGFITKSKFTGLETVSVRRGQIFTRNDWLCKLFNCSRGKVRYQLKKWKDAGIIQIKTVQDRMGMDLGMIITYNWLYEQDQKSHQRRRKKPTKKRPEKRVKSFSTLTTKGENRVNQRNEADQKNLPNHFSTLNREVLNKFNIHGNDVIFEKFKENEKNLQKILNQFTTIQLNPKIAVELLETFEAEIIEDYLKLLEITGDKVKNKAGWLVQALRQQYNLTKVENWRIEEREAKKEEARRAKEQEAKREKEEEQEKITIKKNQAIQQWKEENSEEVENNLYLQVLEEIRITNHSLYRYSLQMRKRDQTVLEAIKSNPFIISNVRIRILELMGFQEGNRSLKQATEDAQRRESVSVSTTGGKTVHMSDILAGWM